MTTINISVPDNLGEWLANRASDSGLASAGEFVCRILLKVQQREAKLEQELLKGLEGPFTPVNDEYWQQLEERIANRLRDARR